MAEILRKIFFLGILAFVFLFPVLNAQVEPEDASLYELADSLVLTEKINGHSPDVQRFRFNARTGTSFAYFPGYGSASNFYVAPGMDLSATSRLTFHAGFMASQGIPYNMRFNPEIQEFGTWTSLSAYVAASYRLTDNLLIYGSGMRSLVSPGMQGFFNPGLDDLSIGASYKIGNFTIGASFHQGQRNPYMSTPFNNNGGYHPSIYFW